MEKDDYQELAKEIAKRLRPYPSRKHYLLELRDGEIVFTLDKMYEEFDAAFDAALDEIFGPHTANEPDEQQP
jgi:hypothetical protein